MYDDAAGSHTAWNTYIPFPNGWFNDGSWSSPGGLAEASTHWANSLDPYVKNGQLGEITGAPRVQANAPDFSLPRLKQPYYLGLSMNGLLSTLNASSVAAPSSCPAFWSGFGKQNVGGRALTNPALICTGTGPCQFNPTAMPQAGVTTAVKADGWFWGTAGISPPAATFGTNSAIVVRADTSAKVWNKLPAPGTVDSRDPNAVFTSLDATGVPIVMKRCSISSSGRAAVPRVLPPGLRWQWALVLHEPRGQLR